MLEIVRPRPWRKLRAALSAVGAALSLSLLPAFALLVFVSVGVPAFPVVATVLLGTQAAVMMRSHAQPPAPAQRAPIPFAVAREQISDRFGPRPS